MASPFIRSSSRNSDNQQFSKHVRASLDQLTRPLLTQTSNVSGELSDHILNSQSTQQQEPFAYLGRNQSTSIQSEDNSIDFGNQSEAAQKKLYSVFREEGWEIISRSIPLMFVTIIFNFQRLASVIIIGHYGDAKYLAAANLGFTFINVTGSSIVIGMLGGLDTLCSQAFTANRRMMSVYLQRGIIVGIALCIPIQLIWTQVWRLLYIMHYDPEVSKLTQSFLNAYVVGLVPNVIYFATQKYLYAQGIYYPSLYMQIVIIPINVTLQYTLVQRMGILGAPTAIQICDCAGAILLTLYARFINGYQCWYGFTFEAFKDIKQYLSISIFALFQLASRQWGQEICTLLAGQISVKALASQGVMMSTWVTLFRIYFPLGVGASNRVGNILGQGPKYANRVKVVSIIAITVTSAISLVVMVPLVIFRTQWGHMFTKDQEVVGLVANTIPYFAPGFMFDAIQTCIGGIIRGCGRQKVGAGINFIGYYIFAIPIAFILVFKYKLGLKGIWIGLLVGIFVAAFIGIFYLAQIDWKQASREALQRMGIRNQLSQTITQQQSLPEEDLLLNTPNDQLEQTYQQKNQKGEESQSNLKVAIESKPLLGKNNNSNV